MQTLSDFAGLRDEAGRVRAKQDLPGDRGIIEWHAVMRKWTGDPAALKHEAMRHYFQYESFEMPVFHALAEHPNSPDKARELIRDAADDPFYQDLTAIRN